MTQIQSYKHLSDNNVDESKSEQKTASFDQERESVINVMDTADKTSPNESDKVLNDGNDANTPRKESVNL